MEMSLGTKSADFGKWTGGGRGRRVLLREPERCAECNRVYISLYPLRRCEEHEGLDEV